MPVTPGLGQLLANTPLKKDNMQHTGQWPQWHSLPKGSFILLQLDQIQCVPLDGVHHPDH